MSKTYLLNLLLTPLNYFFRTFLSLGGRPNPTNPPPGSAPGEVMFEHRAHFQHQMFNLPTLVAVPRRKYEVGSLVELVSVHSDISPILLVIL